MSKNLEIDKSQQLDDCVNRLGLRIADISIAINSNDPELKLQLEGTKNKFLTDEANPDVRIRAALGELSEDIIGEKLFDSGSLWQLYNYDGSYIFRFTSLAFGSHPYKVAYFNQDFTYGEVYLHRPFFQNGRPIDPLGYPLDELLTVNLLAKGRGAEVHACSVVDSGQGHLFVGQSRAGKTTMARLWKDEPGVAVLSDDRIVLRKLDNNIWIYGTPWHGEAGFASPDRAPLTKIYFLSKGMKNELVPISKADAVGRLFVCSFPPFYNQEALNFTLRFFEEVVKSIPCYELKFVPDKQVVEFIQGE
jgi:hypothetical protein